MPNKKPRLTSAVIVVKDNKFLLGQRNKENCKGQWIFPGGGVDFGETVQDAAIREIKEETNLDVEIIKLIAHKELINVHGNYHSVVFFHLAKPKNDNIIANDDLSDVKYFDIEEIKKLNTVKSVEWILREAGYWK